MQLSGYISMKYFFPGWILFIAMDSLNFRPEVYKKGIQFKEHVLVNRYFTESIFCFTAHNSFKNNQ